MKKRTFRCLCALLVFDCFASGCNDKKKITVASRDITYAAYAKGKVDVEGGLIRLASGKDGLITDVLVKEGDAVRRGAPLAVVDDREAKLKLAIADGEVELIRAQLRPLELRQRSAERDLARLKRLTKQDVAPLVQLEQADDLVAQLAAEKSALEAQIHLSEARRDSEHHEVELHQVQAPQDGRIVKVFIHPGDGVSTQSMTPLFLFEPSLPHLVRAELDERFVEAVHPGDDAEILLEADESKNWKGKVLRIGQVFGAQQLSGDAIERADQRMVECIISLGADPLRIGQRVLVRIPAKTTILPPRP
jgi:HlyD family secretion protein